MKSHREVLLFVAIAFVLRISVVGVLHEEGYTGDEKEYLYLATKLAHGQEFVDSNGEWSTKAPLWPFVLSLLFRVFGNGLLIPHLVTCLLGSSIVYLGYKLSITVTDNRFVGLVTAALLAFYPGLIVYSDILQSEAMYIVFVLLMFISLERLIKAPTISSAIMIGIYAALSALTRAIFFGFFIFLVLFLLWMHRDKIQLYGNRLAIAVFVWALCLTPWMIRNFNVHGTFVPISSWGGMSLLLGNNPYSTGTWSSKSGFDEWFAAKSSENGIEFSQTTEIQRSALGRKLAVEFITSEPAETMKLWLKKFYMHWIYPITNSDSNIKLQVICIVGDIFLYTLGGIGLIAMGENRRRFFAAFAAVLFFTTLQVVMHCESRYRLPIVPFIAIFSAVGIALLMDTRRAKEFFDIRRERILVGSWVVIIIGVYSFTAWQFLSGRI